MAEPVESDHALAKPGVVDVVPVAVVEPLIARCEEELTALRRQLEETLQEAEEAEKRLSVHAAAAMYSESFEAEVLAHVARGLSTLTPGHDQDNVHIETPVVQTSLHPSQGEKGTTPVVSEPSATFSGRPPNPESSTRPRTVVVDRGRPRTTVVDRGGPKVDIPSSDPAPPQPMEPPVLVSSPDAAQYITLQASEVVPDSDQNTPVKGDKTELTKKSGKSSKVPALLLIQVGVAVVVVALLLLKLG
jgi:hypothetical protein